MKHIDTKKSIKEAKRKHLESKKPPLRRFML